jgi:hypothetical protein
MSKDEQKTSPAHGISAEEPAVTALLRALPHVEATKDFDFKLKARIARRKERPGYAGYVRVLGIAVPVLVALIIVSVFLLRQPGGGEEISRQQGVPGQETPTARSLPAVPDAPAEERTDVTKQEIPTVPVANHSPAAIPAPERAGQKRDTTLPQGTMGGSFDTAISPSNTILPRGFGGNTVVKRIDPDSTRAKIDVGQFLKFIGIDAARDTAGWTVTDVAADSISESSGVKKGDVIELLDNRRLADTLEIKGSIRKLVVNRGGTKVEITLTQH